MLLLSVLAAIVAQVFCLSSKANNLDAFELHLPPGLTLDPGLKLKYLTVGVGTQNYICTNDNGLSLDGYYWKPTGADAELRDLSNDIGAARSITNDLMRGGKSTMPRPNLARYPIIGKHYFKPAALQMGAKPTPVFELNGIGTILVAKKANVTSPGKPQRNVPWLKLETTQGSFAKFVFRTSTRGGQTPPLKCQQSEYQINQRQPYAAIYSFWA